MICGSAETSATHGSPTDPTRDDLLEETWRGTACAAVAQITQDYDGNVAWASSTREGAVVVVAVLLLFRVAWHLDGH